MEGAKKTAFHIDMPANIAMPLDRRDHIQLRHLLLSYPDVDHKYRGGS